MQDQTSGLPPVRRASVFHLVFLTYSVICSGAYGLEEMISSSGPGLSILMLVALPIVWAVPLVLTCSELAAAHPVEGGYYRWARLAFGDFVGYQAAWLVWLANLATNAAFAVLFANYLGRFIPGLGPMERWVVALLLIWSTTFLNCLGIRLVGTTSVVFTVMIFLPFLFMAIGGLLQWQYNPFLPFTPPGSSWGLALGEGLMLAIWLYSGFEKLTPNAGEIENPSRAFPLALGITLPMVILSYVLPTVVGLAACGDWANWGEAHFTVLAERIGGPWLGMGMALGGLVSNASILMVTILGQSRLPMVLAEDRLFPAPFARVSPRFGTPIVSLLAGAAALSLLSAMDFIALTGLFALVQVLAYMLIYASLLRLRDRGAGATPAGARPFRIPLGRGGLLVMMAPGVAIATSVVAQRVWNGGVFDPWQAALDLGVFVSGPVTYLLFRRRETPPGGRLE